MKTRLLLLTLLLLAGCANRHVQSTVIEPEGFSVPPAVSFHVRTEGLGEHALHVVLLEDAVADRLVHGGWRHEQRDKAELDILIEMNVLEVGDERGTQAECQVSVYIARGAGNWRFEARGDSAGRWKEDRVSTAVTNAARAVADRLLSAQRD